MSTSKSRLLISLPDEVKAALIDLAHRDKMPVATKTERLLEIALELEEDQAWNQIASKRDSGDASFIDHAKAFNI